MLKVQQKVSGAFRSDAGAAAFAQIRGFLSTLTKEHVALMAAFETVVAGQPLSLASPKQLPAALPAKGQPARDAACQLRETAAVASGGTATSEITTTEGYGDTCYQLSGYMRTGAPNGISGVCT